MRGVRKDQPFLTPLAEPSGAVPARLVTFWLAVSRLMRSSRLPGPPETPKATTGPTPLAHNLYWSTFGSIVIVSFVRSALSNWPKGKWTISSVLRTSPLSSASPL